MKKYKTTDGDYLQIVETRNSFVIGWYNPEDDVGLLLGQETEDEDTLVAVKAMRDSGIFLEESYQDLGGFVFETIKDARKAMQIANTALLANAAKRPLPEWAAKALAEGWKPPKGWGPL